MRNARSMRGFTFLELTIAISMSIVIWLVALVVFESSNGLVHDARVRTRAESQHRRDLQALTNFLREVDISTLGGFTGGIATEPTLERVTGADLLDRTFAPTETLRWIEYPEEVDGIGPAGQIRVVSATGSELICDRVPQGGFQIEQQGSNLVINLTTFWQTSQGRSLIVTGSTVVALRNVE